METFASSALSLASSARRELWVARSPTVGDIRLSGCVPDRLAGSRCRPKLAGFCLVERGFRSLRAPA